MPVSEGTDTDPAAIDHIRQAIVDEQVLTIELLNYRKDGSSFWNELYISPIHDDDGMLIYFFASQLDVSDRHQMHELQAIERAMLRKIEHRASTRWHWCRAASASAPPKQLLSSRLGSKVELMH